MGSGYRDDRDALRARNEQLEGALAAKEAEIAQLRAVPAPPVEHPRAIRHRDAPPAPPRGGADPTLEVSVDDIAVAQRVQSAWRACAALGAIYVADCALGVAVRAGLFPDWQGSDSWMVLGATAAIALVVVILCASPLRGLRGMTIEYMAARVYMVWIFGLFLPLHPLFEGLIRIRATHLGGYNFGEHGHSFQPLVVLKRGEARPISVVFLMMATLWPAAEVLLLGPYLRLF